MNSKKHVSSRFVSSRSFLSYLQLPLRLVYVEGRPPQSYVWRQATNDSGQQLGGPSTVMNGHISSPQSPDSQGAPLEMNIPLPGSYVESGAHRLRTFASRKRMAGSSKQGQGVKLGTSALTPGQQGVPHRRDSGVYEHSTGEESQGSQEDMTRPRGRLPPQPGSTSTGLDCLCPLAAECTCSTLMSMGPSVSRPCGANSLLNRNCDEFVPAASSPVYEEIGPVESLTPETAYVYSDSDQSQQNLPFSHQFFKMQRPVREKNPAPPSGIPWKERKKKRKQKPQNQNAAPARPLAYHSNGNSLAFSNVPRIFRPLSPTANNNNRTALAFNAARRNNCDVSEPTSVDTVCELSSRSPSYTSVEVVPLRVGNLTMPDPFRHHLTETSNFRRSPDSTYSDYGSVHNVHDDKKDTEAVRKQASKVYV